MAWYAMQWFVYEGDWHLCHVCHLCQPCHHDMEQGGGGLGAIGKCAMARAVTWVSSRGGLTQTYLTTCREPTPTARKVHSWMDPLWTGNTESVCEVHIGHVMLFAVVGLLLLKIVCT